MRYLLLLLMGCLLINASARAQQRIMFMKNMTEQTPIRDSAVFIRTISRTDTTVALYDFTDATPSGQIIRSGHTAKPDVIQQVGVCTTFYPSGSKLSEISYNKDQTDETIYFPNGKLYLVHQYLYIRNSQGEFDHNEEHFITCADFNGKALITDGNGRYFRYNPEINAPKWIVDQYLRTPKPDSSTEEGGVKNGLRDGEWRGSLYSGTYIEQFAEGKFISGHCTAKDGTQRSYDHMEQTAEYPGGSDKFYKFIGKRVEYPKAALKKKISGKVFATFVIEKDGSLSDIKVIRSPDEEMSATTLNAIRQSPKWTPGYQHGFPVRQQFTIPVTFTPPSW